jgi:hypothetical protein
VGDNKDDRAFLHFRHFMNCGPVKCIFNENSLFQAWNRMLKSIAIGAELFHELIETNSYYVDKTKFIKIFFEEITSKIMLITRPRRFGKTLTLSAFYDFLALDPE